MSAKSTIHERVLGEPGQNGGVWNSKIQVLTEHCGASHMADPHHEQTTGNRGARRWMKDYGTKWCQRPTQHWLSNVEKSGLGSGGSRASFLTTLRFRFIPDGLCINRSKD